MRADLDALVTAIYVLVDDFLPERRGPGAPPRISDAELIALAIAQVFLGLPNDRQFLALARYRLSHLFPYLPKQPGYNKRLRRLVPEIGRSINYLAFSSPSFCDGIRLLDSTPVPCGQSRETTRRSEFAGIAGYGFCRSHSRYFWGFRLYLVCASDGTPIGFELAPANAPEREVAKELLERACSRDPSSRSAAPGLPAQGRHLAGLMPRTAARAKKDRRPRVASGWARSHAMAQPSVLHPASDAGAARTVDELMLLAKRLFSRLAQAFRRMNQASSATQRATRQRPKRRS